MLHQSGERGIGAGEHAELLPLDSKRGVAISNEGVVATAETMADQLRQMDELKIPHHEVVPDYIDAIPGR